MRDRRWKYAVYVDPEDRAAPEYELYDLHADPCESRNLLEHDSGRARGPAAAHERDRLREALVDACARTGTPTRGLTVPVG